MKDALKYKTGNPDITELQVRIRSISYMLTGKSGATDMSMEAGGVAAAMDANHLGAEAGQSEDSSSKKRLDGSKPLTTKKVAQPATSSLNRLFVFRKNSSNMNRPTARPKEKSSAVAIGNKTSL